MRPALLREVVMVALDSLRANKLRSALTILGVVIGITAIVGMTSLIRGFDQSLRDSIRELGPNTIFVAKFSGVSLAAGNEFAELLRRPNLTVEDATAIEKLAPSAGIVDIWLGAGGPPTQTRVFYGNERTKLLAVLGATENFAEHQLPGSPGRDGSSPRARCRAGATSSCSARRRTRRSSARRPPIPSASVCGWARWNTRSSGWSGSGRRPAASTSARTISSSFPKPRIGSSSGFRSSGRAARRTRAC